MRIYRPSAISISDLLDAFSEALQLDADQLAPYVAALQAAGKLAPDDGDAREGDAALFLLTLMARETNPDAAVREADRLWNLTPCRGLATAENGPVAAYQPTVHRFGEYLGGAIEACRKAPDGGSPLAVIRVGREWGGVVTVEDEPPARPCVFTVVYGTHTEPTPDDDLAEFYNAAIIALGRALAVRFAQTRGHTLH